MTLTEYVTLSVAVIGATLGVVNFALRLRDDRVRLKVIPTLAFTSANGVILSSKSRGT